MDVIARAFREPGAHFGVLMGGVIVDDQVQIEFRGHAGIEVVQEGEELLMAMARFALGDDLAGAGLEGGEQSRGAMPVVIVGLAFEVAQAHRQDRLGALQRLNLALFVHAEHQRLVRWIQIQSHNIAHLLHEERIARELEGFAAVRLHPKQRKVALHAALGDAGLSGQFSYAPMRGLCGAFRQGLLKEHRYALVIMRAGPA